MARQYAIVSPVRDEERHIEKTIRSVIGQTVKPAQWVIVDDGSTDRTAAIVERYLPKHPWITLVRRENRGYRKLGGGVVDAFYDGYAQVRAPWDFMVKLDGDLSFGPRYFEELLKRFARDSRLGIASGQPAVPFGNRLVWERTNPAHVRGPAKMYRKECFEQIGGLVPGLGWDVIDEVAAQMRGWTTRSFRELRILHHRPTSSSHGSWLRGKFREGRTTYITGYHPLFAVARGLRQLHERPYVLGGLALVAGYVASALRRVPRYEHAEFRAYLRKQQMRRLRAFFTGRSAF
jgi:biofilm PGA synthesis N-glycosyltransferase PgaC